jgi:hypothetical protein
MQLRGAPLLALLLACAGRVPPPAGPAAAFSDDFEAGLGRWDASRPGVVRIAASGDPRHGQVMVLTSDGDDVHALARGTEGWPGVRLEGEVRFATDKASYLGVIYNHRRRGAREDFGVVYLKSPEGYLQANPHRDRNVGRLIHPEHRAAAPIAPGRWQRFKVEVVGATCHFYVGDAATPQLTFPYFEGTAGRVGLQPRSIGGDVWIDNVTLTPIDRLSYGGPPTPEAFAYHPERLLTSWEVLGPLAGDDDDIARRSAGRGWRPFPVDARGAVVTGRLVDHHGPRSVAYLRTRWRSRAGGAATLHLSTVDDLQLWVNGRFRMFVPRGPAAWFDVGDNPAHDGRRIPLALLPGENELVVRVRGGVYTSGAFYARLEVTDSDAPARTSARR